MTKAPPHLFGLNATCKKVHTECANIFYALSSFGSFPDDRGLKEFTDGLTEAQRRSIKSVRYRIGNIGSYPDQHYRLRDYYQYISNDLTGVNEILLFSSSHEPYKVEGQSKKYDLCEMVFKGVQRVLKHRRIYVQIICYNRQPLYVQGITCEDSFLQLRKLPQSVEDYARRLRVDHFCSAPTSFV